MNYGVQLTEFQKGTIASELETTLVKILLNTVADFCAFPEHLPEAKLWRFWVNVIGSGTFNGLVMAVSHGY